MKKISCIGFAFSMLFITSCQKTHTENFSIESNELKDNPGSAFRESSNNSKCDYSQASSMAISDASDEELPLFTKEYDPSTGKLKKITADMRNIIGGYYYAVPLTVTHLWPLMIFINERNGDTTAILEFDHGGRLSKAKAAVYLLSPYGLVWDNHIDFRFFYQRGKLEEIQHMIGTWQSYIRLKYDNNFKNVSHLSYFTFVGLAGEIDYQYDYARKAKELYYPDEMSGEYFAFWYFLKYLDVFPEVRPENILERSYFTDNSVGAYLLSYERKYFDQMFDGSGRLISYRMQSLAWWLGGDDPQILPVEFWKLNWNCSNHDNN